MFTGIVMGIGRVLTVTPLADGVHIAVDSRALELEDVRLGDSIAHSGVCLTVVARQGTVLEYDVSGETLACSVGLNEPGRKLNLEKALRLGDALDTEAVCAFVKTHYKYIRPSMLLEVLELVGTYTQCEEYIAASLGNTLMVSNGHYVLAYANEVDDPFGKVITRSEKANNVKYN